MKNQLTSLESFEKSLFENFDAYPSSIDEINSFPCYCLEGDTEHDYSTFLRAYKILGAKKADCSPREPKENFILLFGTPENITDTKLMGSSNDALINLWFSLETSPANAYHFSLHLQFEKDIDVSSLEYILDIKPKKITALKDSRGTHKTAKFWHRGPDITGVFTDEDFAAFVQSLAPRLEPLPALMEKYAGSATLTIVFTTIRSAPCLYFDTKTLQTLGQLGISVDVDFLCDIKGE